MRKDLDTGIILATGALVLDLVVGGALTGQPLHKSLGINSSDYTKTLEGVALACGWLYVIARSYDKDYELE